MKNHKVTYIAGGAAQNAARGAAVSIPAAKTVEPKTDLTIYLCPVHSPSKLGCLHRMRR